MPLVKLEPLGICINVSAKSSLWRSLKHAKVDIAATCGGQGTCGTCALRVVEGAEHLTPIQSLERRTLKNVNKDATFYRLTCQASAIESGVVFHLDKNAEKKLTQILVRLKNRLAPRDIHHPLTGSLLVQQGKLITQEIIEKLLSDFVE